MSREKRRWPAMYYGPNGEQQVFQERAEVPDGWVDHPAKVGASTQRTQSPPPPPPGKPDIYPRLLDTNGNEYTSTREIKAGLDAGLLTPDQVEKIERQQENPRGTVFKMVEKARRDAEKEQSPPEQSPPADDDSDEIVTREEAIAELRAAGVEIADDASDAEIEAALNSLEG